jgi:repressor LexA
MSKSQTTRRNRAKLSERQRQILNFIEAFLDENGYPPTIREIGKAVKIGSTSVVNYNLNKLVREGFLERSQKVSRGLLLVKDNDEASNGKGSSASRVQAARETSVIQIPLAGQIAASKPVEFFGIHYDDDAVVEVPMTMLGKTPPDQVYALNVAGNSMIDAMISDGDVVLLRRQQTADNGDMVAVWLSDDNETTLKYFYNEGSRVRLQPANPEMDPIYVDPAQVEIQGRVLAVMRSL